MQFRLSVFYLSVKNLPRINDQILKTALLTANARGGPLASLLAGHPGSRLRGTGLAAPRRGDQPGAACGFKSHPICQRPSLGAVFSVLN
jgi:hypothetical protein